MKHQVKYVEIPVGATVNHRYMPCAQAFTCMNRTTSKTPLSCFIKHKHTLETGVTGK